MAFSEVVDARAPADDRAERLVAAARELANETGSSAFTVAQVAARAGLSLKSFYRCFPGKDDLLLALIGDDSSIGAALVRGRITDHPEPMRAYVDALFAMASRPDATGYAGILVREHRRLSEVNPDGLDRALSPLTELLATLIPTEDPDRDARTMLGVCISGIHDVVLGRVSDPHEHARYLYRFCTDGLGC